MPNNYSGIKSSNDSNVSNRDQLVRQILIDIEKLKSIEAEIREAKANGQDTTSLDTTRNSLNGSIGSNQISLATANQSLKNLLMDYDAYIDHTQVVSNLPDNVPILLFPVRIETRYHKYMNGPNEAYQLWIRIFPDEVAIEAHETLLSDAEIKEGRAYWTNIWNETDQVKIINAWDVLCRQFTSQRAAWIVKELVDESAMTPKPATPPFWTDAQLEKRFTTWTSAPQTRVMPDAFVVNAYATYTLPNPSPTVSKQGKAIPFNLKVGIDPNNEDSIKRTGSNEENLDASDDIKWLIDFDEAILKGMGVKMDLTQAQYDAGFERITVLGVKALVNDLQGKDLVEDLMDNHHYHAGLSLLKQGTNTKNTDEGPSGFTDYEFGNVLSHNIERETEKISPGTNVERNKKDGQRLAEALGIDMSIFDHVYNADGYDIRDAMTINTVLFPATIGYTMDVVMNPVFSTNVVTAYNVVEETRDFSSEYVRARGALSSIRVRKQPYGILPVTAYSKFQNPLSEPKKDYYDDVYQLTGNFDGTWSTAVSDIKVAGNSDPQQAFVEALGKKAVSQEFYSRYGAGPNYIWNNLAFNDMPAEAGQWYNQMNNFSQQTLLQTGFAPSPVPFALQMNFKEDQGLVNAPITDSQPLSDSRPLEGIGNSSTNYITWLRTSSLIQIRDEDFGNIGEGGMEPPNSLLYIFLRQSLLLEYYAVACRLLEYPEGQKGEKEIINIQNVPTEGVNVPPELQYNSSESRWAVFDQLYQGQPMGIYLDSPPALALPEMQNMIQIREGMQILEGLPTADLALLFGEHVDICSFRLDSWKLGLMNQRLNAMRLNSDGTVKKQGIYVGAFGWVENVYKNERSLLASPNLPSPDYTETNIEEMAGNKGYIHAPSQNQAIAAAILRAGYEAKATDTDNKNHEINLSSERVRIALDIFQGIKNGQKLTALLGYEFERAIHERYPSLELDKFIYPFRTKYKIEILTSEFDGAAETVTAINVLHAKAILDDFRVDEDSVFTGLVFSGTPPYSPTNNDKIAIKNELRRLLGILDAVGDMAVSEGIFQLVNNNYEAASALSSSMTGNANPPDAQVIDTPRNGISITNRVIKQLEPHAYVISHGNIPANDWSSIVLSRRAVAEPSLNEWLKEKLPAMPGDYEIYTSYQDDSPTPTTVIRRVYLDDLKIQPIDLVYIAPDNLSDNESELAQRVKKYVRDTDDLEFNKEINIDFEAAADTDKIRFIELHAYLRYLRRFILDGRHIKSSDYCQSGSIDAALADKYDYADIYQRVNVVINGILDTAPPNDYLLKGLVQIKLDIDQVLSSITIQNPLLADVNKLADAVLMAADFGIERSIPASRESISTDAVTALIDAANSVSSLIDKRLIEAALYFNTTASPAPPVNPAPDFTDEEKARYVASLVKCSKVLFGESFRMFPKIKVQDNSKTVLNSKFKLTGTPPVSPNTLLNDQSEPLVMESWLSGVSRVREKIANLEMVTMLSDVVMENTELDGLEFRPFQFPYDDDTYDRWMALGLDIDSDADKAKLKSNRLCLAISEDIDTDFNNYICGWVIDDWTEVIPNSDEISGLAFHYDQPEAKAPQTLLLAVPPVITGHWDWEDLMATVNESLDEAKKRAVDYETIASSPFGHILPALYFPVSDGAMTIGPSFFTIENLF